MQSGNTKPADKTRADEHVFTSTATKGAEKRMIFLPLFPVDPLFGPPSVERDRPTSRLTRPHAVLLSLSLPLPSICLRVSAAVAAWVRVGLCLCAKGHDSHSHTNTRILLRHSGSKYSSVSSLLSLSRRLWRQQLRSDESRRARDKSKRRRERKAAQGDRAFPANPSA